ncbi:solute carrier family 49 member A3-like isoform X1 [Lytechinus variegatus]|uniref:solute carrier family 49 member A3-like isoform X1 n=2 Tax=Lytechinus variegatus TaxID=7654 RepID=UPI001BB1A9A0|nr:solute carrier family 49 member A3-like isoform X1 [Lytechinus variegatus]
MSQYKPLFNQRSDDDEFGSGAGGSGPALPIPGGPAFTRGNVSRTGAAEYTLYKRRWLVVAVLAFVNISSALTWITFAPIANYAAVYLNTTDANVNWLSTIYMVTTPFGFVAVWLLDSYGLAPVIILGACCNTVGIVIRYVSVFSFFSNYRYLVVMVGQGLASLAQPCFLFTPTKVAAVWFPEGQRTTANTVGSTSNPLGILIGMLLSSMLVKEPDDLKFLLLVYMIPGIVSGVLAVVVMCYCKNAPPTPPSASAASHHSSFFSGLKQIIRIKAFWVLFIVFGAGLAVFNSIITIIEEVLCPVGYSDNFSGVCGAVLIGSGIVGAFVSGLYVDRTKKFALVAKVSFSLCAVCIVALSVITRYPNIPAAIVGVCAVVGFFGFAQFPVSLELGVEATYPVSEGTSAGFLIMSGQVQGFLLMLAAEWLARPLTSQEQLSNSCKVPHTVPSATVASMFLDDSGIMEDLYVGDAVSQDMTVTMLFFAGYASLAAIIYVLGFHTRYKRLRSEHCNAADAILNFSRHHSGSNTQNVIY